VIARGRHDRLANIAGGAGDAVDQILLVIHVYPFHRRRLSGFTVSCALMTEPRRTFTAHLRVRFGETDAMGVANNAAYLQYFEIGRIEFLRAAGHSYAEVHNGGIDMVVAEAGIRYLRPLWFDDEFAVACSLTDLARASFTFTYELTRGDEVVATGFTRHACVDRASMRPVRVPEWLRDL
jgi:acyl-CoA thioester hydrolase